MCTFGFRGLHTRRISLLALVGATALIGHSGTAHATDPGSAQCGALQQQVQQQVGDFDKKEHRNPKRYQKAVEKLLDPAVQAGRISAACAECIRVPFGRSIPVDAHPACGPGAAPLAQPATPSPDETAPSGAAEEGSTSQAQGHFGLIPVAGEGDSCNFFIGCGGGLYCLSDGLCHRFCNAPSDCPYGQSCTGGVCQGAFLDAACNTDLDCGCHPDRHCLRGECQGPFVANCESDAQCPGDLNLCQHGCCRSVECRADNIAGCTAAGMVCDTSSNKCVECTREASTCRADQHCDFATSSCVDECSSGQVFVRSDGIPQCTACVTPGTTGLTQCAPSLTRRLDGARIDDRRRIQPGGITDVLRSQACPLNQVCALEVGSSRGFCIAKCDGIRPPDVPLDPRIPIDPRIPKDPRLPTVRP